MAVFVRRQPETKDTGGKGTAKLKVLEKRVLLPSILILFVGIAASGIMSFFSLYAIEKGFQSVGMFFFLIAGASFFIRLISGRVFDRCGAAAILIPASLFSIAGLSILYFAQTNTMFLQRLYAMGLVSAQYFPPSKHGVSILWKSMNMRMQWERSLIFSIWGLAEGPYY